ncbi:MAG: DUF3067 family protein [Vulcanococcus sp. Clear-D1]|nr:DUF3067 family protein [Vulcanococcus sp. Clear-D1]
MDVAPPAPAGRTGLVPAACNMLLRAPASVTLPPDAPLSSAEVLEILRQRWQASYDLQLIVRRGRLYLQVMWGYLEQQSFPMTAEQYEAQLEDLVATLNGLGVAAQVRGWLLTTTDKPRLGKAMNLALDLPEGRASEFLI